MDHLPHFFLISPAALTTQIQFLVLPLYGTKRAHLFGKFLNKYSNLLTLQFFLCNAHMNVLGGKTWKVFPWGMGRGRLYYKTTMFKGDTTLLLR